MMKRIAIAALLLLLVAAAGFAEPENGGALDLQVFAMDCDATHCQVTREQAEGISRFQEGALLTISRQRLELERLRRGCRGERDS